MTIKPTKILILFFFFLSIESFAAPEKNKQIDQIIEIENWKNFKSELLQHGMPKLKDITEANIMNTFHISRPITADQQIFLMELSDIIINDMIEQIDDKQLLKNVNQSYQSLTQEQINSLIELYSNPKMQQVGKKIPLMLAKTLDQTSELFNNILNSEEIKKIAKVSHKK